MYPPPSELSDAVGERKAASRIKCWFVVSITRELLTLICARDYLLELIFILF